MRTNHKVASFLGKRLSDGFHRIVVQIQLQLGCRLSGIFRKKTRRRKTCVVILFFLSLEVSKEHFFAVGRWQDTNSTKDEMPLACFFVIQLRCCGHDERKTILAMGEVTSKGLNKILFGFSVYCVQILGLKRSLEWLPTVAPRRQQQYSRSRIRLKIFPKLVFGKHLNPSFETVHLSNFGVKCKYDYFEQYSF